MEKFSFILKYEIFSFYRYKSPLSIHYPHPSPHFVVRTSFNMSQKIQRIGNFTYSYTPLNCLASLCRFPRDVFLHSKARGKSIYSIILERGMI